MNTEHLKGINNYFKITYRIFKSKSKNLIFYHFSDLLVKINIILTLILYIINQ